MEECVVPLNALKNLQELSVLLQLVLVMLLLFAMGSLPLLAALHLDLLQTATVPPLTMDLTVSWLVAICTPIAQCVEEFLLVDGVVPLVLANNSALPPMLLVVNSSLDPTAIAPALV